jgi:hypothetical protein
MAIDMLSIPAMSSAPERAFSGAKITITDCRNRSHMQMIEWLECLKSWCSEIEWIEDKEAFERCEHPVLKGPLVEEAVGDDEVEAEDIPGVI